MSFAATAATPALTGQLGLPMVYLVDDEDVVRDALAWLLRTRRLLSEGFASAEAFEALLTQRLPEGAPPDWPTAPSCLLLDVRMPGMSPPGRPKGEFRSAQHEGAPMSGLALFERLVERGLHQRLPVIFLTGHGDVPMAVAAIQRGAFDFVEKPFSDNALVDRVVRALHASEQVLLALTARRRVERALAELTEREREVMQEVLEGKPNKLIADALDISVRTVEVHRARVFDKMQVKSAVELANLLRPAAAAG